VLAQKAHDVNDGDAAGSIPLAGAGFLVTSVDRSAVQQEEGRRRAGGAEWPRFVQAAFRELPFAGESFDAVLCLFSSIGYRGEEGDGRRSASSCTCSNSARRWSSRRCTATG
jgi:Methyltransferase domain